MASVNGLKIFYFYCSTKKKLQVIPTILYSDTVSAFVGFVNGLLIQESDVLHSVGERVK